MRIRQLDPPDPRCTCGHVYDDHDLDGKCVIGGCDCERFHEWTEQDDAEEYGDYLSDLSREDALDAEAKDAPRHDGCYKDAP